VTSTMPVPAGLLAVIVEGLTMMTFVASAPPKETVAGPTKFVPVMVTAVPPFVRPDGGEMPVTIGGGT